MYSDKKIYKGYTLFFKNKDEEAYNNVKDIVDGNYNILKIIKDTERNYVAVIAINNHKYILKEIRAEVNLFQRRVQTILKKGEVVTTLNNFLMLEKQNITGLTKVYAAIIKRNICIEKSYLLMEYIDGCEIKTINDIDKIMTFIVNLHKLKRYHGDLNTSNFLIRKNGNIAVLDSQLKKDIFFNFKRSYDILTLKEDLLVLKLNYDVYRRANINKFSIGFILAFIIKRLKKTKLINIIRNQKKKIREKKYEHKKSNEINEDKNCER
ncbi:lipopolysaccharide core heptose(II) kinase RfaY [uncultured Fusobacterium sp.]|uniref:lipopolysaccharide core heptose(II) kinase RfaY n=1 Tax=uncultured Fusobacterium sp. TaxID=159267 RepID=UPI00258F140D|nr:lipopolysaccharide core heptose(II) kinase RfaY [uncultured Fusobacterium sp.]